MSVTEQVFYSLEQQKIIKQKIQKLYWLQERFGDLAKYQGFDQVEILTEMMQCAILLRLQIFAKSHD